MPNVKSMNDLPGVMGMEEVSGFFPADPRIKEAVLGGILGACVGDALGVPVEFESRETLSQNPVTDMRGYGAYNQPPGTWSDDTSMTLCLLDSLAIGLDYTDIMKKFLLWADKAEYTAHNEVFDMGIATRKALMRFSQGEAPLSCGGISELDNGNGSLMRILPLTFYFYIQRWACEYIHDNNYRTDDEVFSTIHDVSSLTHAHKRSQIACGLYVSIADCFIVYNEKHKAGKTVIHGMKNGLKKAKEFYESQPEYAEELKHYERLFKEDFVDLPINEIKSSGYVVDTLEAALWCLMNTHNYKDCVLQAVNLGGDTDTVAAVAGGLAGIYYGYEAIPENWVNQIARLDYIKTLCEALR